MAKETNKSTTILLLVIAGALLFLIGSFTGNVINWGNFGQPKTITSTTGLTTAQKLSVIDMLGNCQVVVSKDPYRTGYETCKDLNLGYCIMSMAPNDYRFSNQSVLTQCNEASSTVFTVKSTICCKA